MSDISWAKLLDENRLSVETLWQLTANIIFDGKEISQTQHDQMRKAYFMGFSECFKVMTDFASDLSEDKACDFFSKIGLELNKFVDDVFKEFKERT